MDKYSKREKYVTPKHVSEIPYPNMDKHFYGK